jgi:UTP--glucose-1-phosphate uridylyltransferase
VQEVAESAVSKYGIIGLKEKPLEDDVWIVSTLVEKPRMSEAPSNYAIMGRYILCPEIFDILGELSPGAAGEIQLTDAIRILNNHQTVLAHNFKGIRYDVGDKFGFIKATVDFAMMREDLRKEVLPYLEKIIQQRVN